MLIIGKNAREVTLQEIQIINSVAEKFKVDFPNTQIKQKENIIGIGEPNRHLFCYFSDNGEFRIKFKMQSESISPYGDLSEYINETINAFKSGVFENKKANSSNVETTTIQHSLLTQDEQIFFKILMKNIDPKTGELIGLCQETLEMLNNIFNKTLNVKPFKNNIKPRQLNKVIIDEYIAGVKISDLSKKYELKSKKIKKILHKGGIAPKAMWICDTYEKTKIKIEKNKGSENVGSRWSDDEEKQLLGEYISGLSVSEIASLHKRKIGGIQSRLVKLGFAEKRSDVPDTYKND